MSARDFGQRGADVGAEPVERAPRVGKRTLTASVPAQMKQAGDAPASGRAGAAPEVPVGAMTTSSVLPAPVQRKMEDAFDFDFSAVRVHEGSGAAELGAAAYTQGTDLHFAPGFYDPSSGSGQELIGHELAHVVQQSEGRVATSTQFKGVDVNDDTHLEREADDWGAQAARGERVARSGSGSASAPGASATAAAQCKVIQRAPLPTHWGRFIDTTYTETAQGVDIKLDFEPGAEVDATSIGFIQTVHATVGGSATVIDPSHRDRQVPAGEEGEGRIIDRLSTANTPIYGSPNLGAGDGLEDTPENTGDSTRPVGPGAGKRKYNLGHHYTDDAGPHAQNAEMADGPNGGGPNSSRTFETTVLALAGNQQGTYYGSVSWGYDRDASGASTKRPFELVSEGVPSEAFLNAAEAWNDSTARGTWATSVATDLLDRPGGTATASLAAGTTLTDRGAVSLAGVMYRRVNVTSGDHSGSSGVVRVSDIADQGDGAATVNLPVPDVHVLTEAQALNDGVDGPYRYFDTLPIGTRVTLTDQTHGMGPMDKVWIHVVDGPATGHEGFIDRAIMIPE
jgi:hypothetical protein